MTGGFNGLKGIPGLPGLDSYTAAYYVAAVALVLASPARRLAVPRAARRAVGGARAQRAPRRAVRLRHEPAEGASRSARAACSPASAARSTRRSRGSSRRSCAASALSADLVIWAAVGGRGRLLGPVLGAIVIGALTSEPARPLPVLGDRASRSSSSSSCCSFPQGLVGVFAPLERRFGGARRDAAAPIAAPARAEAARRARDSSSTASRCGSARSRSSTGSRSRSTGRGIYCVIGPNGAGKTSTFNMLTGELPAQAGRVRVRRPRARPAADASHRAPRHRPQVPDPVGVPAPRRSPTTSRSRCGAARARPARRCCGRACAAGRSPVLEALRARYPFLADAERTRGRSSRTASARSSSSRWRCSASRACCCSTSRAPASRRRRPPRSST